MKLEPKRFWPLIIIPGLLLWAGLTLYSRYQQQNSLAEIKRRGALRVGLDASFPPFETLDESGQVVGFDADIARAIAADLGVEAVFVNIGFDGLYDALKIGRVDMLLSGLPVDPYLTRDIAYSVNYFNAGQVLLSSNPQIQSVDDLAGQSVAVEWGSLGDMEARRLQKTIAEIDLNPQPDAATALQYDIAIVDAVSGLGASQRQIVTYLSDDWYAAAVRIEDKALLDEINNTLTRLIQSGELGRLQDRWF